MTANDRALRALGRFGAPALGLVLALSVTACEDLLEVKNPNNVTEEALSDPVAATSLVNGVLELVADGVNSSALVYGTAADEFDWSGSRDAWRELDEGKLSNGFNEFTDAAFPEMAQARWMADEAIRILEEQQGAGTLLDDENLAKAYTWAAIAYVSAADMYDDFVLPVLKGESVEPVGTAGMGALYDTAIGYLNSAEGLTSDDELTTIILAMRARAKFSKAIWDLVGQQPITTGLATDTYGAAADATAALAAASGPNWKFEMGFSAGSGSSDYGSWVNSRQEMRLGSEYVAPDPEDPTWLDQVVLMDLIDTSKPSPIVDAIQKAFRAAELNAPITVVSNREMHLILAEAALAAGNTGGFQTNINNLRDLDGLTDWTPASGVSATDMLAHARRTNLFLQGRRLADHYRFQQPAQAWDAGSQALTSPGTFLPITARECFANTFIGAEKCSK